jgi:hypothetical protein
VINIFKDLILKLRGKRVEHEAIDKEVLDVLYSLLIDVRFDLVEAFYNIAKRRLRELYDLYSMTMLKFDKLLQLLRRLLNRPVEYDLKRLSDNEINNYIYTLPLELSISIRSLIQNTKMLKEFSQSTTQHYLKSIISNIDDYIEDIAKYTDMILSNKN